MYLLADQSSNAKLSKNLGVTAAWQTSILYLSPSDSSGLVNLCPAASPGCRAACLNTAGRGAMNSVQAGRLRKTRLYVEDRHEFDRQLIADLETIARRQARTGIKQAVRLNGTSDIAWEDHPIYRGFQRYDGIPQAFPELQFYDYTKLPTRAMKSISGVYNSKFWPKNYQLTFSRSEVNEVIAKKLAIVGVNIAVVFHGTQLPSHWYGRKVIDGTAHDMRFLDEQERVPGDPPGVIVGLLTKGRAKHDGTGFAVTINEENVA